MNFVALLGRLTADPEIRYTNNGKAVTTFTLAVNRPYKNEQGNYDADFINIVLWGKTAEVVANHVHKGQRLLVEGRLQIRSYDAKDGSKRWVTEVIGNSVEFIEKKAAADGDADYGSGFESMGSQVFDDGIPF